MRELTLHRGTSGAGMRAMRAGRDLVLDPGWADGAALAPGAALDDYLAPEDRVAADAAARKAAAVWRAAHAGALTVDGLDLTDVCEVELLADCFLPAERIARALPRALAALGATALRTDALDRATADVVLAVASHAGVRRAAAAVQTPRTAPASRGLGVSALAALRVTGLPARVRGRIVCAPYWHLDPVYARLAAGGRQLTPVPAGIALPALGTRGALRIAARGGWLGLPGARAQLRAARVLSKRIAALDADDAIHRAALSVVRREGVDALAAWNHARAAFGRGRARLLCLPWDSPAATRVLVHAMRAAGGTSLVVQHGFNAGFGDPDKLAADHIALWSEQDAQALAGRVRPQVSLTVTGNPGAAHLAAPRTRVARRDRTLLLLDYPARLSASVDCRVSTRHVQTALAGLSSVGPGTEVVVRPHPSDCETDSYAALGANVAGVDVTIDASTAIESLLTTVDLCVGAMSTATLQAAVLGVPTVLLDVAGIERPWPFNGAPDALPRATDAAELTAATDAARARDIVAGSDAAREALGARSGAIDDVVALVARLSAGAG